MKNFQGFRWDPETGMPAGGDGRDRKRMQRRDRAAQGAAKTAVTGAQDTAANEGSSAAGISSTLTPFLTQELLHPQGYSQADRTQQLNQGEAGAGGATAGVTGAAGLEAARTRNPAAFTASLDQAARSRAQAAAATSTGIAAKSADLAQDQQQSAAKGLSGMYGEDTDAMLKSMGQESGDIDAETQAGKSGWLQNAEGVVNTLANAGSAAAGVKKAFG